MLLASFVVPFIFFVAAIFYQYMFEMPPCFKCIQQRSLLLLTGFLSLSGWFVISSADPIYPRGYIFKSTVSSMFMVASSVAAYFAYRIASEHLALNENELSFLFSVCESGSPFPEWLPQLDEWLPSLFAATGSCAGDIATAFNIEMPYFVMASALFTGITAACFITQTILTIKNR